jgi:hypothetical protein
MEAFPDSERRQERRFNRKGVVMNIHHELRRNLAYKILDILSDTKKCPGILATITSVSFKVAFRHLTCSGISDLVV